MFDGIDVSADNPKDLAGFFGPGHVDAQMRQTFQACWMALPKERKNVDELEKQMRRLFERAVKDFREDRQAFGKWAVKVWLSYNLNRTRKKGLGSIVQSYP